MKIEGRANNVQHADCDKFQVLNEDLERYAYNIKWIIRKISIYY
jgi:hypothetical protein